MIELNEMLKIADIHADKIKMAIADLEQILPFDAHKVQTITKDHLLLTDLLVHRFGKLQDLIGNKIIDGFLEYTGDYSRSLSMLDKINKLEQLEVLEDANIWNEMRKIRNHITHEYPEHPEFTASDLNKIIQLAPYLLTILDNIKVRTRK